MIILAETIAEPDKYFWYLIALGSLGLLLKMINAHMGKIDKILEALQQSVSNLYVWKASTEERLSQAEDDIVEIKKDKGSG